MAVPISTQYISIFRRLPLGWCATLLTTIGERNRAQIRNLELCGNVRDTLSRFDGSNSESLTQLKNHPKMQMAKIGASCKLNENVKFVTELLKREKPPLLTELRFVVPTEWRMQHSPDFWLYCDGLRYLYFTEIATSLHWIKLKVTVQEGGGIIAPEIIESLNCNGIDIIYEKGSYNQDVDCGLEKRMALMAKLDNLDYLTGVSYLFIVEECSVAAFGGRATRRAVIDKTARVLQGFGGCRFQQINNWVCWNCLHRHVYRNPAYRSMPMYCEPSRICPGVPQPPGGQLHQYCVFMLTQCVMIKNPKRAKRIGIVKDENHIRQWMG